VQNYRAKIPDVSNDALPMHTLFVGHNPSISTWKTGHYFANPTNHFWKLVTKSGLIDSINDEDKTNNIQINDDFMVTRGFGFIDFIESPGNDANAIIKAAIDANRAEFPKRIENYANSINSQLKRLCFVGKKQWKQQFSQNLSKCDHGLQDIELRPKHWPIQIKKLEVWVLPSPSGRAVISSAERLESYILLAKELKNGD
jgi:TDG/mug DNA glycosylase family protein